MKPKDILHSIINTATTTGRGRRSAPGFQRLGSVESPNRSHSTRNSSGHQENRQRYHHQRHPPIELKSLKRIKTTTLPNVEEESLNGESAPEIDDAEDIQENETRLGLKGKRPSSYHPLKPAVISRRNDDEARFQIYNSTTTSMSEELPSEFMDESCQFSLSDVRLALRDNTELSLENDDFDLGGSRNRSTPRHNVGHGNSNSDLQSDFSCSRRLPFLSRLNYFRKPHGLLLCGVLVLLACGLIFFLLATVKRVHLYYHHQLQSLQNIENDYNLNVLRTLQWPLYDIESRKLNLSYDTKVHGLLDLDKILEGKDSEEKESEEHTEPPRNETQPENHDNSTSGNTKSDHQHPSINGQPVDELVVKMSFKVADDILHGKLNANSTTLEKLSWKGLASAVAVAEMRERLNISKTNTSIDGVLNDSLCNPELPEVHCNETEWYRSIDGNCNNLIYKTWGSHYSQFRRIINPSIGFKGSRDLAGDPMLNSSQVPTPETVSEKVHRGTPRVDLSASAILPLWGMFVLHDTVKIANSPVNCCPDHADHHKNLILTPNDASNASSDDSLTCNLKSSMLYTHGSRALPSQCSSNVPALYPSCEMDTRSSFNLATPYIDASNIYGSSPEVTDKLRDKKQGKLKSHKGHTLHNMEFLPRAESLGGSCFFGYPINANIKHCLMSGDTDINQVAPLTALTTLLLRQHNRIASKLSRRNRHWDDDKLFHESRRILIAQIQHVTYNEFLPQILGKEMLELSGLSLGKDDNEEDFHMYNRDVNPSVSTAFAGAVGYFWYSMVPGTFKSVSIKYKSRYAATYDINKLIMKPDRLQHGEVLEALVRGLASMNTNQVGIEFSPELQKLRLPTNTTLDLAKMIIERGRDLDIPPYVEWRKVCGFPEVKAFEDIKKSWYSDAYTKITGVYKNIQDVDLFTGMLAENPIPSGMVGPTLACLLADQFVRFKQGDRYWYEVLVNFHHFTPEQLQEIRGTTLARIICDNTHNFDQIQQWPMRLPSSPQNPLLSCKDPRIPSLNFHHWIEDTKTVKLKYQVNKSIIASEMNDSSLTWRFESNEASSSSLESQEDNVTSEESGSINTTGVKSNNDDLSKLTNKSTTTSPVKKVDLGLLHRHALLENIPMG